MCRERERMMIIITEMNEMDSYLPGIKLLGSDLFILGSLPSSSVVIPVTLPLVIWSQDRKSQCENSCQKVTIQEVPEQNYRICRIHLYPLHRKDKKNKNKWQTSSQ